MTDWYQHILYVKRLNHTFHFISVMIVWVTTLCRCFKQLLSHQLCHCTEDPVTTIGSRLPFGPRSERCDWLASVTGIVLTVCLWGPKLWHRLPGQQSVPTHTRVHILEITHSDSEGNVSVCKDTCAWSLKHTHTHTHTNLPITTQLIDTSHVCAAVGPSVCLCCILRLCCGHIITYSPVCLITTCHCGDTLCRNWTLTRP